MISEPHFVCGIFLVKWFFVVEFVRELIFSRLLFAVLYPTFRRVLGFGANVGQWCCIVDLEEPSGSRRDRIIYLDKRPKRSKESSYRRSAHGIIMRGELSIIYCAMTFPPLVRFDSLVGVSGTRRLLFERKLDAIFRCEHHDWYIYVEKSAGLFWNLVVCSQGQSTKA